MTEPFAPPPDAKDWTWVLSRRCPDCGFDAAAVQRQDLPRLLEEQVAAWLPVLERDDVARRPQPLVWSPLEYACHVRDVYRVFDERLLLMLTQHDPLFASWDQDATAVAERYHAQDPQRVADGLAEAGHALADGFAEVAPDQWGRTGRRSDRARFTVLTLGRYASHDPAHHLWDVAGGVVTSG